MNIKCPHCGTEDIVDECKYGRFVNCESCGKGFVAGTTKVRDGRLSQTANVGLSPANQDGISQNQIIDENVGQPCNNFSEWRYFLAWLAYSTGSLLVWFIIFCLIAGIFVMFDIGPVSAFVASIVLLIPSGYFAFRYIAMPIIRQGGNACGSGLTHAVNTGLNPEKQVDVSSCQTIGTNVAKAYADVPEGRYFFAWLVYSMGSWPVSAVIWAMFVGVYAHGGFANYGPIQLLFICLTVLLMPFLGYLAFRYVAIPIVNQSSRFKWIIVGVLTVISLLLVLPMIFVSVRFVSGHNETTPGLLQKESYESSKLSYNLASINQMVCAVEEGVVNGLDIGCVPYDFPAAVLFSLDNRDGNAPSFGTAYKYKIDEIDSMLTFRISDVYPKGVLVRLEQAMYSNRLEFVGVKRHDNWAFIRTDRYYKMGEKLHSGYYILCGGAQCRIRVKDSNRYRDLKVKAFREMDEVIADTRGLLKKTGK